VAVSTDTEWEKWGAQDPYYGVLTNSKYRAANLTEQAKEEFFALGRWHVQHVLGVCRAHLDAGFNPQRVLEFGCGVGRVAIPFVQTGAQVVGVDISPSMLAEARRNCEAAGVSSGLELLASDDSLSLVQGSFDLVHSCIVIQHIEIERGLRIFQELVRRVRPGGIGAIHVTFAWDLYRANHGVQPPPKVPARPPWWRQLRQQAGAMLRKPSKTERQGETSDPEMQMNFYNLSQLMFVLQQAGIGKVHTELTDHGGAIGAFMFFRKPE